MQVQDFFKQEVKNINFYGANKPKYQKDMQVYTFLNGSLVDLSAFDTESKLTSFYSLIKERLIDLFDETTIKEYDNKDNYEGFIYFDQTRDLDYKETLNPSQTSLALIEAESASYNYLLVQVISESDEMLIWLKLKSPLKVINNTFYNETNQFELTIKQDGININNYPSINIDLNSIAFINYNDNFFIFNKDLYQKYLNLDNYFMHQANMFIDEQSALVCDGEVITKANAKLVYENFESINYLCEQLDKDLISEEKLIQSISNLDLDLTYENKRFILKKPSELLNLLLLSSGCVGINPLDQSIIMVKKPQFLIQD